MEPSRKRLAHFVWVVRNVIDISTFFIWPTPWQEVPLFNMFSCERGIFSSYDMSVGLVVFF